MAKQTKTETAPDGAKAIPAEDTASGAKTVPAKNTANSAKTVPPENAQDTPAESVPDGVETFPLETAPLKTAAKPRRISPRRVSRASVERVAGIQTWIDEMPDGDARRYLEDRLLPQMEWYRKKSAECKKWYIRLMWASIIVGAMIPVFSVFTDGGIAMKALIALLGSMATAINAILALHNYKDLWNTYRKTREDLFQTLYYYFNHTGIFEEVEEQDRQDRLLIKICEERMEQEHAGWSAILDK